MLILSYDTLIDLVSPKEMIAAVETALRQQNLGRVVAPRRIHLEYQGNTLLAMPAAAREGIGVKLVSVAPGNRARSLPTTSGVMLINDPDTGMPLALLNAAALTAQRTGAVGALGVKYLSSPAVRAVGIVGCGTQGIWQAIYACSIRPIEEIHAFDPVSENLDRFEETVGRRFPGATIYRSTSTRELLQSADLIITATTSSQPVLPDAIELLAGKLFISVGSFKPSMQELPDAVYQLAGTIAVDSRHAIQEAGDIINSVAKGLVPADEVYPISEHVLGARSFVPGTTVYKTVGAAEFDLFAAIALYRAARAQSLGVEIEI